MGLIWDWGVMARGSIFRLSKYPILFAVSGPKAYEVYGFWDQKPQILGTGTLWDWSL